MMEQNPMGWQHSGNSIDLIKIMFGKEESMLGVGDDCAEKHARSCNRVSDPTSYFPRNR